MGKDFTPTHFQSHALCFWEVKSHSIFLQSTMENIKIAAQAGLKSAQSSSRDLRDFRKMLDGLYERET